MADIFLSYNREDAGVARMFAEAFARDGFSVWWDATLRSGEAYDEVTEAALKGAPAVVVLWSKRSVASRWVRTEATVADRNKTLVPVMIEPCERPIMFELTQTADLGHWRGDDGDAAWRGFLSDVRTFVDRKPVEVAPPPQPAASVETAPRRAGKRGEAPSLAVLPFTNRSGLAEDEVFADGMVDDVIAALSQGVNVTVLGSMVTAGLRARGGIADPAAIGRQLGVRYLLEGNVRRVGSNLRVAAQILEAATGAVLWSGRFDRPLSELAELQEDLVTEIAASLDVEVQSLELQRILRKPADLTAWEAMVRSNAVYQRLDAASLKRALDEARRAVAIDPDYAAAHAQIAMASSVVYLLTVPDDAAETARIRGLIDQALELESEDALVLALTGGACNFIGMAQEGFRLLGRAIRKAPTHGTAHYHFGIAHCLLGRYDPAIAHLDTAIRLFAGSPLLYLTIAWRAAALLRAGRWTEGEAAFDDTLALAPDFLLAMAQKAVCLIRRGEPAAALALYRAVRAHEVYRQDQIEMILRRALGTTAAGDEVLAAVRALADEAARAA